MVLGAHEHVFGDPTKPPQVPYNTHTPTPPENTKRFTKHTTHSGKRINARFGIHRTHTPTVSRCKSIDTSTYTQTYTDSECSPVSSCLQQQERHRRYPQTSIQSGARSTRTRFGDPTKRLVASYTTHTHKHPDDRQTVCHLPHTHRHTHRRAYAAHTHPQCPGVNCSAQRHTHTYTDRSVRPYRRPS